MTSPDWTDAEKASLRQLWEQDPRLSLIEIAKRLDRHRNAVVGMVHRMKLPARPPPLIVRAEVPPPCAPAAPAIAATQPEPMAGMPPLAAPGTCQFPVWGHHPPPRPPRFCGAPVARYSDGTRAVYCPRHYAVAYQAVTTRKLR